MNFVATDHYTLSVQQNCYYTLVLLAGAMPVASEETIEFEGLARPLSCRDIAEHRSPTPFVALSLLPFGVLEFQSSILRAIDLGEAFAVLGRASLWHVPA